MDPTKVDSTAPLDFLMTISSGGYNDWSRADVQKVYDNWFKTCTLPENIFVPPDYAREA